MSQERTEGIVARSVDFGNTSRIVTFLTPDRGRLACMARGVKRRKNRLGPLLDMFNRLELIYYWKEGRSVQQLAEATLLDGFGGIKSDLRKMLFSAFPLELAYKVVHENEPSQRLYEALIRGLQNLDAPENDPKVQGCLLVMQLLAAAGFAPTLSGCAGCGRPVGDAPGFLMNGGVTCPSCKADRRLSPGAYRSLRALADSPDACASIEQADEVFSALSDFAKYQLETDFRSLRVLKQSVED